MTPEQLEKIRVLVAERGLGWRRLPMCRADGSTYEAWQRPHPRGADGWLGVPELPDFPRDIAAAWKVFEKKLAREGWLIGQEGDEWCIWGGTRFPDGSRDIEYTAATAPLVICIATLRELGVEVPP